MILQEIQYIIAEEATVRRDGVMRFEAPLFCKSVRLVDGPPNHIKGQKGLSAVEINEAFPGQEPLEKVEDPAQDGRIQRQPPLFLVAIRTLKVAPICQYDRETG